MGRAQSEGASCESLLLSLREWLRPTGRLKAAEQAALCLAALDSGILDHLTRFCSGELRGSAIATVHALTGAAASDGDAVLRIVQHQGCMQALFRVAIHSSASPNVVEMAIATAHELYARNPASKDLSILTNNLSWSITKKGM